MVLTPAVMGCASCLAPALQLMPHRCPDASSRGEGKRGASSERAGAGNAKEPTASPLHWRQSRWRRRGRGCFLECLSTREGGGGEGGAGGGGMVLSAFWPCVIAPWVPWREPQPGQEPRPHSTPILEGKRLSHRGGGNGQILTQAAGPGVSWPPAGSGAASSVCQNPVTTGPGRNCCRQRGHSYGARLRFVHPEQRAGLRWQRQRALGAEDSIGPRPRGAALLVGHDSCCLPAALGHHCPATASSGCCPRRYRQRGNTTKPKQLLPCKMPRPGRTVAGSPGQGWLRTEGSFCYRWALRSFRLTLFYR